jgi:uncharacterized membrane protein SpoIIM required for sporulation
VLESLFNFREINRRPYLALLWAFVIVTVSLLIAIRVNFTMTVNGAEVNLTSMLGLSFALISSSYFMTVLIRKEEMLEEKFINKHYRKKFWVRHEKDILIFLYFFAGATLAYAVWAVILPADNFQVQLNSICSMRGELSACGNLATGAVSSDDLRFQSILSNNIYVGIFSFVLAFVFGAGSSFIILWNAGILGIYIGLISRHLFDIPMQSIRFLPHGIPEIAGYICVGLAGSLISTAILRKAEGKTILKVSIDSALVALLGFGLIILGAAIEVYI